MHAKLLSSPLYICPEMELQNHKVITYVSFFFEEALYYSL